MTLRERLPRWLGGKPAQASEESRAAGPPIEWYPAYSEWFGPGIGSQAGHETLLRENIGVPDRATRAIANRISTLDPLIKVSRRVTDGTAEDETLDDHPLKLLIDRPHPNLSRAQLLRLTAQWIVTVGEAYWHKVGNGFGLPAELHPIPPAQIVPVIKQNVIAGYRVKDGGGREEVIDPDLVVRFFFPDPESPWTSEGYLGPSGLEADSMKFASEHVRAHYQHDATPQTVLKALEGADSFAPDERERFYTLWRQHYHQRAGNRRGVPAILPTGYDLVTLAAQSGAELVPLLEFLRDELLMDFGVSRSILGQVVSGDRSSAEVNQWVFDLFTVTPITNLISDGITLQLCPDFDPSLFCAFAPFVSEDKRFALEQEMADLVNKVRSPQQVLRDRGSRPEDAPWGEYPVGQLGQVPYDGEAYDLGMDEPSAFGEPEEEEPPEEERKRLVPAGSARAAFFHPEAEWQRQVKREKKYVPTFEREMKAVLSIQERSVIRKLKDATPRVRVTAADVFTPDEWRNLFEKRVDPVRLKAFETILGESLAGFGIEEFVFTDEMRFLLRQQGALLVKHANATTQNMIAKQLAEGTAEGEGIDALASRIRGVFRTRKHHARTIARTEVLKASQEAQLASFELADVSAQQWNTSRDAAVRDSHVYAEGQIAQRGQAFDLMGEPALGPGIGLGHGQLSAGNSINCRCFLTPVLED